MKRYQFKQEDLDGAVENILYREFEKYLEETGKELKYKDVNERFKYYDDPEECLSDAIEYCARSLYPRAWHKYLGDEFIKLIEQDSISLDYGCGAGNVGIYLNQKGYKCNFIDIEGEITDFVRWRIKQRPSKRNFIPKVLGHTRYTALRSNTYDLVFMINVLEHLKDPIAIIENIHRILKKDGYFYYQWSTEEHGLDLLTHDDYKKKVYPVINKLFKKVNKNDERLWQPR